LWVNFWLEFPNLGWHRSNNRVLVISYHIETLPVVSVSELFYNKVHLTLLFTSCQLAVKRYSYTSSSFLMFLFLVFTLSAPLLHLTFYFL